MGGSCKRRATLIRQDGLRSPRPAKHRRVAGIGYFGKRTAEELANRFVSYPSRVSRGSASALSQEGAERRIEAEVLMAIVTRRDILDSAVIGAGAQQLQQSSQLRRSGTSLRRDPERPPSRAAGRAADIVMIAKIAVADPVRPRRVLDDRAGLFRSNIRCVQASNGKTA
jgi:hypothetical protein